MTDFTCLRSIRQHTIAGAAAVAVLVLGLGGWTATTELAGAVVAPGTLVVESNVKKVQHLTGGVIVDLKVRDGDDVEAGDVLVVLDGTQARANLQILDGGLNELAARKARLEAERDGAERVSFQAEVATRASDESLKRLQESEEKLFAFRRVSREGQKQQFRKRIAQLDQEVIGLSAQSVAKEREITLIAKELSSTQDLYNKGLITLARVTELERTAARLEGERGQLIAAIAQARGKMAEIELQIMQIDQQARSEAAAQLADLRARANELAERKTAAEDQIKRLEIRAPQAGRVHELAVHTIGGVVQAGEPLMVIVPAGSHLAADVRIAPAEVDRVHPGQSVALRFPSFDYGTTPEIKGVLTRISPDVSYDQRLGATYYNGRIDISGDEIAKLGSVKLLPGMPVEAFILSERRTVLSYLTKPLTDQVAHAFRHR